MATRRRRARVRDRPRRGSGLAAAGSASSPSRSASSLPREAAEKTLASHRRRASGNRDDCRDARGAGSISPTRVRIVAVVEARHSVHRRGRARFRSHLRCGLALSPDGGAAFGGQILAGDAGSVSSCRWDRSTIARDFSRWQSHRLLLDAAGCISDRSRSLEPRSRFKEWKRPSSRPSPAFSPDSQSIAYWAADRTLKRIGVRGRRGAHHLSARGESAGVELGS